jgi:hypothetical protein
MANVNGVSDLPPPAVAYSKPGAYDHHSIPGESARLRPLVSGRSARFSPTPLRFATVGLYQRLSVAIRFQISARGFRTKRRF